MHALGCVGGEGGRTCRPRREPCRAGGGGLDSAPPCLRAARRWVGGGAGRGRPGHAGTITLVRGLDAHDGAGMAGRR